MLVYQKIMMFLERLTGTLEGDHALGYLGRDLLLDLIFVSLLRLLSLSICSVGVLLGCGRALALLLPT